jgi:hypothetical protein
MRPRTLAEAPREVAVGQEAHQCLRDLVGTIRVDEEPRLALPDDVGDPAGPRADDGPTAAERLEHDPRRPLGARREQEQPGVVERLDDGRRLQAAIPGHLGREIADERRRDVAVAAVADDPQ